MELIRLKVNQIREEKHLLSHFDLNNIVDTISTNNIDYRIYDEDIKLEIRNNASYIILAEYEAKVEVDKKSKFSGFMHNIYNDLIIKICNELQEASQAIKDSEIEKEKVEKDISYIKEEIAKLNILEKETSQILNETLLFLKKQNGVKDDKVGCPVCNTEFYLSEIIKKVEEKIAQENPIIKEKLQSLSEYETLYKNISTNFEILYKNKVIQSIEFFVFELDYFMKAISSLGSYLKTINKKQGQNIENYDEKIKKIEENNEKLLRKISQLKITGDFNAIKSNITELKVYHSTIIKGLGYETSNISVEQIEEESNKVLTRMRIFESKLVAHKIEIDNIDESLNLRKSEIERTNNSLNLALQNINSIETKVLECENFLVTNKKLAELHLLVVRLKDIEVKINNIERISAKIQMLQEATKASVENLNQKIVDQSEEFINIIFNRIYAHPSFRNLKLCMDFNRRDNNVLYLQCKNKEDKVVNPAFTFSSAQVNVIAISIFLALALEQRCTKLEHVFLDDPIQDMDDINVLSFVDIIRSIISSDKFNKRFILSTHDEQFYRLMVKKFRFINTRVFRFGDYNCNGPFFSYHDTLISPKELLLEYKEFNEEIKRINRGDNKN